MDTRPALMGMALTAACFFKPDGPAGQPDDAAIDGAVGDADADAGTQFNVAFVTSMDTISLGNKASVDELDAICKTLGGSGTWRAWFSTPTMSASARLGSARGWVDKTQRPIVDQVGDLVGGRIFYPLRLDENGNDVTLGAESFALTATRSNGTHAGSNCFTEPNGSLVIGAPDGTTVSWTEVGTQSCTAAGHLYCFQIDHQTPVTQPTATGRRAFLTTTATVGDRDGQANLDLHCQQEAINFSLPDPTRFIALTAVTNATARSRLSTGLPLVRPDGVVFLTGTLAQLAPNNVTLAGTYSSAAVWTGAPAIDVLPSGSNVTCGNWTDVTSGHTGYSDRSRPLSFGGGSIVNCTLPQQLYCVEQ